MAVIGAVFHDFVMQDGLAQVREVRADRLGRKAVEYFRISEGSLQNGLGTEGAVTASSNPWLKQLSDDINVPAGTDAGALLQGLQGRLIRFVLCTMRKFVPISPAST